MKKIWIVVFCFFFLPSYAQKNNDVRLTSLPYYNFGKGLGLTSPDSLFQFNIRFRMQNRVGYLRDEAGNPAFDAQVRRLRLRFDGFVGSPQFLYVIQLSFAPGDVGRLEEGANLNVIRDAAIIYRPNAKWDIVFGQTKLPGNRQRINSSGALQLTDRSITNARFNIDRDFGIQVNYLGEQRSSSSFNVKTAISSGDGRNFTANPDDGLAYTGKLEWYPLGGFQNAGVFFEGDLVREPSPKLMLSAAYHYNHKAKRTLGVLGEDLYASRNLQAILADFLFKYRGLAIQGSYMNRNTENPITRNQAGSIRRVFVGEGWDFQPSYHFKNDFELIGRLSYVQPYTSLAALEPKQREWTLGVTRYLWEHAFKVQTEVTFDEFFYLDGARKQAWFARFQVEMGI
ncbi:MAG: porin [Spirosomataceae bacterium]